VQGKTLATPTGHALGSPGSTAAAPVPQGGVGAPMFTSSMAAQPPTSTSSSALGGPPASSSPMSGQSALGVALPPVVVYVTVDGQAMVAALGR
jgi:hypothetical protein